MKTGLICLAGWVCLPAQAYTPDTIGLTLLNAVYPGLDGTGVRVAQVEADSGSTGDFEVNPAVVYHPVSLFTYISATGSSSSYPNAEGGESVHAEDVAQFFYEPYGGASTNVVHVDNYEASDFIQSSLLGGYILPSSNLGDPVVNQSFNVTGLSTSQQQSMDSTYDNYAAQYNTLFVSAVGNGGAVNPPSTCYNGLAVAAYGGSSSVGPTPDNGRAKPDLTVPSNETSFSTPYASGAAAVLVQAGLRGDGGADTNSAVSICTLKALLINGAVKPHDWTNNSPSPLDTRYGAGNLNMFNSYMQLAGGKHAYSVAATVPTGTAHPPTGFTGPVGVLSGWDYNTNTSSGSSDGVNHYYFNVTNATHALTFTTTATLVWNRHQNQTAINKLNLFLYNTANNNLVAASISTVDNVQHLWVPKLPAGQYDLQVWKAGGSYVSAAEPYALAFAFTSARLSASLTSTTSMTVSWPAYPAGYMMESNPNLTTANSWNTNYPLPAISQGAYHQVVGTSSSPMFFRLVMP